MLLELKVYVILCLFFSRSNYTRDPSRAKPGYNQNKKLKYNKSKMNHKLQDKYENNQSPERYRSEGRRVSGHTHISVTSIDR